MKTKNKKPYAVMMTSNAHDNKWIVWKRYAKEVAAQAAIPGFKDKYTFCVFKVEQI